MMADSKGRVQGTAELACLVSAGLEGGGARRAPSRVRMCGRQRWLHSDSLGSKAHPLTASCTLTAPLSIAYVAPRSLASPVDPLPGPSKSRPEQVGRACAAQWRGIRAVEQIYTSPNV